MIRRRTLDVSGLPDIDVSSQEPIWWGQICLCCIEGAMFCILIACYFYFRLSLDMWPPPGTQLPHVAIPTVTLILAIVSCLGSYRASEGAKKNERGAMLRGLLLNLALGCAFLILRGYAWYTLNFNWASDVHGSTVWTILGLHTMDATADLLFTAVLIVALIFGRTGRSMRLAVHVDSVVWYFLVLIWIPLYIVIYWAPRFVGAPA
ncbi:MAG: cytochrome c oxidase subunit 3 [Acidobacteriia bacterium]|nr:cytochrome c oxidase subunit 3 [Terriglobia bacterium]